MAKVVEPQVVAIARACACEQRKVARRPAGQPASLKCREKRFSEPGLDEAGTAKRIAIPDQRNCLVSRYDLTAHGLAPPVRCSPQGIAGIGGGCRIEALVDVLAPNRAFLPDRCSLGPLTMINQGWAISARACCGAFMSVPMAMGLA